MTPGRFLLILSLAGVSLFATTVLGADMLLHDPEPRAARAIFASIVPFATAAWLILRHEDDLDRAATRRALLIVLVVAVSARAILVFMPPDSSDVFRYVWDGRVQWAGVNPYRYVPADPALAFLRDPAIYPNINRASYAPTIYPPAAQLIFAAAGAAGGGVAAMKLAMVGCEVLIGLALLALLQRRGLPPLRILLYAWHPLPLFEFAGSGHVDAAAIAFMMLAFVAADCGRTVRAGVLLALGIATKFFPLIAAPALYRRWDWRLAVTCVMGVSLLYLPYLSVGYRVFGFLGGYAHEEALDDGTGFFLLGYLDQQFDLPLWARSAYLAGGVAILGAGALQAIFRRDPSHTGAKSALFLLAAFTVIVTPHLPWYFTWTVPLLCLVPSPSIFYLTCAAPLLYWQVHEPDQPVYSLLLYLPFYAILAGEVALRGALRLKENRLHVAHAS